MSDVVLDPVALVNAAPATALCVLVYLELRQQRQLIRTQSDTLTAIQTAIEVIAQLVGVKLRRKTQPLPIVRDPDETE